MVIYVIQVKSVAGLSIDIEVAANHKTAVLIAEKLRRRWADNDVVNSIIIDYYSCNDTSDNTRIKKVIKGYGEKESLPIVIDYSID